MNNSATASDKAPLEAGSPGAGAWDGRTIALVVMIVFVVLVAIFHTLQYVFEFLSR